MKRNITSKSGFTLIELIIVLAIIGVLAGTITPLVLMTLHKERETGTVVELREFKEGIVGDPEIVTKEVRTDFGYIGDMGSMPSKIEDLYQKGTQPAFSYDTTKKTGAGWKGPYIDPSLVENLASLKLDAYGNEYTYDDTEFTDSTVGATVSAKIVSKGTDGVTGGGDDLSTYVYKPEAFSKVVGVIVDEQGKRVPAVTVKMNYPSDGILTTNEPPSITSDSAGHYEFTDIPYGNRSITIEPGLAFAADTATVSGSTDQDVAFKITNFSASDITITSFKADFTVTPTAYYETLVIGGTTVYNSASSRVASGETVTFVGITVPGSGAAAEGKAFPVRVQSAMTHVEDLNIASAVSKGGTITISMETFTDAESGGGNATDMTGVTFDITFSNGSRTLFAMP
ncbi:MAG: prepilin-type N-terminal cleavage/methylation domain-containing protein [Candidatus Brocadiales bacterium]